MMQCSNNAQFGHIALVLMLMLTGCALHTETSEKEKNGREKPKQQKKLFNKN